MPQPGSTIEHAMSAPTRLLLLIALWSSSTSAAPPASQAQRTAHSATASHAAISLGPWSVQWSETQLTATAYGQPAMSLSEHIDGPDEHGYRSQEHFQVRSMVGPWLSVDHSWYSEGGAHPSYGIDRTTHDITRGGQAIALNEIFSEAVLFEALRADTVIQKYLRDASVETLSELQQSLYGECAVSFSGLLTSWAFHHVRGDQVAVRIGLGHGCEVERGNFTELGLYLPIPSHLRSTIMAADEAGTLMDDLSPR